MPLVDYPSSDDSNSEETAGKDDSISLKRKRDARENTQDSSSLPPLPPTFHDLYASTVRSSTRDDPSLHGGRKRVTPHVEGNWPTHVYIEWYPSTTEYATLDTLISKIKKGSEDIEAMNGGNEIHSFLTSDLGSPLPLHISLSRPIGFLTNKKDEFTTSLENGLKASGVRPFSISLTTLTWVPNFEKTRYFLVLRIQPPPLNELNKLLHVTNRVVQGLSQPPLYTNPTAPTAIIATDHKRRRSSMKEGTDWSSIQDRSEAFHFSIAWSLKAPSNWLDELTKRVEKECKGQIGKIRLNVDEVKNKVGNVVHRVELVKREVEGGSLFGL